MKRETVFSALMVLAAAFAFVAAPAGSPAAPTQPAEAQTVTGACTSVKFLTAGHLDCGGGITQPNKDDKLSLYQAALQTDSANNQYFTILNNQLETTEEVAWMRAERAAARAAANGTTETAANVDVTESLERYYTIHERNLLDKWNMYVTGLEAYESQDDSLSYDMFTQRRFLASKDMNLADSASLNDSSITGFGNTSVSLPNGNTTTVRTVEVTAEGQVTDGNGDTTTKTQTVSVAPPFQHRYTLYVEEPDYKFTNATFEWSPNYVLLNEPTSEYDARNYLHYEIFEGRYERIRNQLSNMTNETETWLSNVYPALESGEVNPEDLISNVNRMFNYATQGGSNATYSEGYIALASLGLDPAGNSSYLSLTYEHDGVSGNVTKDGMLLSDTAPGGSWEVGRTYDSTNISGPQMVVTLDGEEHTINGTFTINGAYQDDGTEIANPTLDAPGNDYDVSNTSETQELILTLSEKINRYHNLTTQNSGGGGVGGGGGLDLGFGGVMSWLGGLGAGVRQVAMYAVGIGLLFLLVVVVVS